MRYVFGALALIFLCGDLFLLLKSYLESRRERKTPMEISGADLTLLRRQEILQPLIRLTEYYRKGDTDLVDACVEETIQTEDILILGTNPREVFRGRDGAAGLLYGDWKYWGQGRWNPEDTALYPAGAGFYFVMRGSVKLNLWHFTIPVRVTGLLDQSSGDWRISKLQFVNDVNSNYVIVSWGISLALLLSLILFGLACALSI